jgi:hypothetical protein
LFLSGLDSIVILSFLYYISKYVILADVLNLTMKTSIWHIVLLI